MSFVDGERRRIGRRGGGSGAAGGGGAPGVWRANEPAGWTLAEDWPYDSATESGKGLSAASGSVANFSIASDSGAPRSQPNVGRILFPLGFAGGGEPCDNFKSFAVWRRKAYFCTAFKVSANWDGHPTEVNKIYHIFINGSNRLFFLARGAGSSALRPQFGFQGLAAAYNAAAQGGEGNDISGWLLSNQGGQDPSIFRDTWVNPWEVIIDAGTPGGADGSVKWWINGVLTGLYTGIPFTALAGSATVQEIHWAPTWGGGGAFNIAADQYQFTDQMYISSSDV